MPGYHCIFGCQRSGTTLLESLLRVHPAYTSFFGEVGRASYKCAKYLASPSGGLVGLKLPQLTATAAVPIVVARTDCRAIVIVRHPLDVVASMKRIGWLKSQPGKQLGGSIWGTGGYVGAVHCKDYQGSLRWIRDAMVVARQWKLKKWDPVAAAAWVWRLAAHRWHLPGVIQVSYEDLVKANPKHLVTMQRVLGLRALPGEELLSLKEKQRTSTFAHTDYRAPLYSRSVGRWVKELTGAEVKTVWSICGPTAEEIGYSVGKK